MFYTYNRGRYKTLYSAESGDFCSCIFQRNCYVIFEGEFIVQRNGQDL